MARPPAIEVETGVRVDLNVRSLGLTDDQFLQLCSDNRDFRIEMTRNGELIILPPPGLKTAKRNFIIIQRLANWTEQDGAGVGFSTDAGVTLPNGAKRGPDAAWMTRERWNAIPSDQQEKLPTICPDFVLELRSPSDAISDVQAKMEEYMANGALLGWLLDPFENCAYIYRPNQAPERIETPTILSGDPVLPGFKFDFREIL
jgi:Uma2 family endonuclease